MLDAGADPLSVSGAPGIMEPTANSISSPRHPSSDRGGRNPCICFQVQPVDCRRANTTTAGSWDEAYNTRVVLLASGTQTPARAMPHHPEAQSPGRLEPAHRRPRI